MTALTAKQARLLDEFVGHGWHRQWIIDVGQAYGMPSGLTCPDLGFVTAQPSGVVVSVRGEEQVRLRWREVVELLRSGAQESLFDATVFEDRYELASGIETVQVQGGVL